MLADRYQGHCLSSRNDVSRGEQGRLFFTDPRYGPRRGLEMADEAVYRLDPDGTLTQVVGQPDVEWPNGLAITPDCTELYVVDSNHPVGGNCKIWAFTLDRDGSAVAWPLVYDPCQGRGGDGLELDSGDNLHVCAGIMRPRTADETTDVPPGAYIITPGGQLIEVIHIPQGVITNCCFGTADLPTSFVTAGHTLFSTRVGTAGYHASVQPSAAI